MGGRVVLLMACCAIQVHALDLDPRPWLRSTLAPMLEGTPPAPAVLTLADLDRDGILRLQIVLDRLGFPPGKIDGRNGEFLGKALARSQRARGVNAPGIIDGGLDLTGFGSVSIPYTVTAQDLRFVGPCPTRVEEQAQVAVLPYATVSEFLSERFHCAPALLHQLNPAWTSEDLPAGTVVQVPNVIPFRIEDLPKRGPVPTQPALRQRIVQVHRAERMLDVWDGQHLIASFPITPGGGSVETPAGTWRITGIAAAPTFRWDKSVLETGQRSDTFFLLPPGPNNPVGVFWCALNRPGIGIHGTDNPLTIGRAASHGCIRMANWDIVRLVPRITAGVTVVIE